MTSHPHERIRPVEDAGQLCHEVGGIVAALNEGDPW
jgi:hypothetical protein